MAISSCLSMLSQMALAILTGPFKTAQPLLALSMLLRSARRDIATVTMSDLKICFVISAEHEAEKSMIDTPPNLQLTELPAVKSSKIRNLTPKRGVKRKKRHRI